MKHGRAIARIALVVVTAACALLTATRLELSSDLSALFPNRGEAAHLARFARAFGGTEVAMVLVRGKRAEDVEAAARELGEALRSKPAVSRVLDRAPPPRDLHPTEAWLFAGPSARQRLASAVTPEGMKTRLHQTYELLLAPGSGDASEWFAKDPLRLATVPWEARAELAAGVRASTEDAFVADEGRARLLVVEAHGSAFHGPSAEAFVRDADDAMAAMKRAHPEVTAELSGGHAVARATEQLLRRDFTVSSAVSLILASITFLVTFRRARALVAVLPPLTLGTLWTTGLAAVFTHGLSAISIAFTAVVVGVGVDTGVHVYAALLDARRKGLSPHEAASYARRETWRPTLTAAIVAGLAFGSLALSEVAALGQLGILCGVGEVLTAIAILAVTPEIGAWLERGAPPPARPSRWTTIFLVLSRTRTRAAITLGVTLVPAAVLLAIGWPRPADALVAIRPKNLAPLVAQDEVFALFGGRAGQWVVLSIDRDPERAKERADAIAEALDPLAADHTIDGFDSLATFAPTLATQRMRLAARDSLDLPSRKPALAAALKEAGFDEEGTAPALEAFEHPSHELVPADPKASATLGWLLSRHVAQDKGETLVATYVRATGDPTRDERVVRAIKEADPNAVMTGYPYLERTLRASLAHDLPRVGLLALAMAAIALRAALRGFRPVALALFVLGVEIAAVGVAMRLLALRWHLYDALVLPVLIGITLDESMFLLHAAQQARDKKANDDATIENAMRTQGPLVASTALTTASGFAALLVCRFEGLRDLGAVGALGAVLGLVASLVVVPAGLRVFRSAR